MHFDHLGVATRDADAAAELFGTLIDAPVVHDESGQGMRFVFLELENGYFELIEPLSEDSPVAGFLAEEGPGIHHVAVHVEDIHAAMAQAREAGYDLLQDEPQTGAWGHEIAFVDPGDADGVLLEYVA